MEIKNLLEKLNIKNNQKGCNTGGIWIGEGEILSSFSPVNDLLLNDFGVWIASRTGIYLYDKNKFSKWLNETGYYDVNHNLLENVVNVEREFKLIDIARKKVEIQMTRLVNLDRKTITRQRTEQHLLRNYLFKHKKQGECAICNNQYPISFLATAHIKKRSKCTDQEKKDFKVVMPACHLGCDKVYEDGYVIVKDGIIKNNITSKPSTDDLRTFISSITDNKCKYYDNETAKYFKYHAKQHN